MQNNRFSHARRIVLGLATALTLGLWAGCQSTPITNLTPGALPENPSQIYTISARIAPKKNGYVPNSVVPHIIIDGKSFTMNKSAIGENLYEFEYQLPAGRTELAYYFLINFQIQDANGNLRSDEEYTDVQRAQIVGRYVLSLEVNRGPVGARVSILGRGFTPADIVYFDNSPVRTVFESPNAVSFFVPAVDANRNYKVSLGSSVGSSPVGTFRVDAVGGSAENPSSNVASATGFSAGPLTVSPSSLTLRQGEKVSVTFNTPVTANANGLLIDVTTDVPESVIMPEVLVPPGSKTITVTVQGGRPGTGSLFVKGAGATADVTIPISVK